MAPIDVVISSDDSSEDSELRAIDEYKDESPTGDSASSDFRALPAWASGHSRPSAKDPSPKRTAIANGSSVNFNGVNASSSVRPSYGDRFGASSSRASADDRNDHDKNSSQQTLKRMLPGSFYSSGPFSRPSLVENVGSSQIRQTQEKSYQSAWSTPKDAGAIHMKDHSSRGIGALYTGVNDPLHHPGMGDERAAGTDERLIYQAALQDLNQPKVEATLPDGLLSVSLLRHQRIALAWMLQKETSSVHCLGGILADDQGLGKTVSMIAIIQTQRSSQEKAKSKNVGVMKAQALNLDDDDENTGTTSQEPKQSAEPDDFQVIPEASTMKGFRRKRPAAGTLVVCPASILRQWARELDEKVTNEAKLDVLIYHGGNRPRDPVELAKYDVVITTYAIVTDRKSVV